MKTKKLDYDLIQKDYTTNENDDDTLRNIKEAIDRLTPAEKKIWLTYVEYGTYSDTAREYSVSAPTAKTKILAIKNKILSQLEYTPLATDEK